MVSENDSFRSVNRAEAVAYLVFGPGQRFVEFTKVCCIGLQPFVALSHLIFMTELFSHDVSTINTQPIEQLDLYQFRAINTIKALISYQNILFNFRENTFTPNKAIQVLGHSQCTYCCEVWSVHRGLLIPKYCGGLCLRSQRYM